MKIGFAFLLAALLLGCEGDLPPVHQDATLPDADASDVGPVSVEDAPVVEDASEDAVSDANAPGDSNPLHDMDSH